MNRVRAVLAWGRIAVVTLMSVLLLAGCRSARGPMGGTPPPGDMSIDHLRPGDKITVMFSDIPNPPAPFVGTIRDDGKILLHFNQEFEAAGKRASDLEKDIHDRYVPRFYQRLTVSVKTEERSYFVSGEVKLPGQKPYLGEVYILQAISAAGGFTDFANRRAVLVIRRDGQSMEVDCVKAQSNPKFNVPIYPGDTILVKQSLL